MASRPRTTVTVSARRGGGRALRPVVSGRVGADQLASVQRARMLSAMVEVACERGAGSVNVAHVVERSGVSRRTFYEMFADREDCFVAAFEQSLAFATERVMATYDPGAQWRERIRSGLVGLLSFLDEEPRLGRLLIVESLAGGPTVMARRAETITKLNRVVDEGAKQTKAAANLPSLTGEGVVGAVLTLLQNRLLDPAHEASFIGLTNELLSMIVLPYLGAAAARRELDRPLPVRELGEREPLLSDPFKSAGMRLTYRTVRVLVAVGEHPGASNALIGRLAEISDQGQISKLLSRLERIGMLENTGAREKGGPNTWTLTDQGARIVNNIRAHTDTHDLAEGAR